MTQSIPEDPSRPLNQLDSVSAAPAGQPAAPAARPADVVVRAYRPEDVPAMAHIWNQVVEDGIAFPQEDMLDDASAREFFASQTYCGVAQEVAREVTREVPHEVAQEAAGNETSGATGGDILGMYILHPNNVGRCGHLCNTSYAVAREARGRKVGERLVADSLIQGREHGFRILQFNAVVATNAPARHLYEKLGFVQLGVIPGGFRMKDGHYEDICPYYHEL